MTSYVMAFIHLDCRSYNELEIASSTHVIYAAQVFFVLCRIYFIDPTIFSSSKTWKNVLVNVVIC